MVAGDILAIFAAGAVLSAALAGAFYAGFRMGRTSSAPSPRPMPQLSEEEQRKIKDFRNHFDGMMNYDLSKALATKKGRVVDGN